MRFTRAGFILLLTLLLLACGSRPLAPVGTLEGASPQTKQSTVKRPTTSPPRKTNQAASGAIHTVKSGDTLYSISWRYGLDYKKIAAYNGIKSPYTIHVGQRLRLSSTKISVKPQQAATKQIPKQAVTRVLSSRAAILWRWPTQGKILELYSSKEPGNKGIDIAGKAGQTIVAAATGKVVYGGNGLPRYGNLLIIKHNETYLSAYAHNQILLVKEGQQVVAGQKIALLGKTGTQRNKLHFEIRYNGRPINPLPLLPKQ